MDKVPAIISTKDLDYLNDIFEWSFGISKLCYHFSKEANDEDIKGMFNNTYQLHKEICERVINILG